MIARLQKLLLPPVRRAWRASARPAAATAALAAIAVGLWWERPSLALIVPASIVFAALAWSHLRGSNHA